jgi:large subunit ribosomal protein L30
MVKAKVKLVKSLIRVSKDQKATVYALGLKKVNQEVVKEVNPAILGMLKKVSHLIKIEIVNE